MPYTPNQDREPAVGDPVKFQEAGYTAADDYGPWVHGVITNIWTPDGQVVRFAHVQTDEGDVWTVEEKRLEYNA